MDAVVLIGGEGTRLRPLTYDIPKQMLPVVDRPMIEHVVGWLAWHGIGRIVLSVGYRPDAFVEAYPDGEMAGVRIAYAAEPEPLDTAGALRYAAEAASLEGTLVAVNGDVLSDFDVGSLLAFHRSHGAEASIQLTPVEEPSAFGVVPVTEEGRAKAFVEKPPPGTATTNMVNAGCYVLEASVLERIPPGRRVSMEREVFPGIIADGGLFAMGSDSYWLDTGTPEKYLQASLDILCGRRSPYSLPAVPEVEPGLFRHPSAAAAGSVVAPAFLGDGAIVAEGAVVASSVLAPGAVVSRGASISGSIVLGGARVGEDAVVADSVVGPGAVLGRGSRVVEVSVIGARFEVADGSLLRAERLPSQ